MQLGKVIGTVVSTQKDDALVGYSLLVVQLEYPGEGLTPERLVAVDTVGAGVGERVLVTQDDPARANLPGSAPVDATIVGIVDTVDVAP
jgi:ethanolamine utilization protein EutN